MFCPFCGSQVKDDSVFCQKCGKKVVSDAASAAAAAPAAAAAAAAPAAAAAAAAPAAAAAASAAAAPAADAAESKAAPSSATAGGPGKKLSKKALTAIIAGAGVLVLAIVLVIVLVSVLGNKGNGNYIKPSGDTSFFEKDDELYIVNVRGELTKLNVGDGSVYESKFDADHDKAVFLIERREESDSDDWFSRYDYFYDIYYYDGREAVKIAGDIEDNSPLVLISRDGNAVAYEKEDGVYLYSGGKTTIISNKADLTAISPDGKTVGYITYPESSDMMKGYYYTGGKEVFLVNYGYPEVITNGANLVYMVRESASGDSSAIYVQKKDKEDTRVKVSDPDSLDFACMNYDETQLFYLTDRGTFLCKNGKEPVKLSNNRLYPLLPYSAFNDSHSFYLNIKDFEDLYYYEQSGFSDGDIVRLGGEETTTIISDISLYVDDTMYYPDSGVIIYEDNDGLSYVKTTPDAEPKLVLDEADYRDYYISEDGKTVFYWNDYYELYSKKLDGKGNKIYDGSEEAYGTCYSLGNKLYFIEEGKLYASDGGKVKEIQISDKKIVSMFATDLKIFACDEDGKVYVLSDGKSFKKISDTDFIADDGGYFWD